MSYKIYEAYKIKDKNPYDVLWDIKEKTIKKIKKNCIQYILPRYQSAEEPIAEINHIRKQISIGTLAPERHRLDITCLIHVFPYKNNYYIIPKADHFSTLVAYVFDFLGRDKRLEDFSYWTSSEKDDDIPTSEWNKRKKVWTNVKNSLLLTIADDKNIWEFIPDSKTLDKIIKKGKHE